MSNSDKKPPNLDHVKRAILEGRMAAAAKKMKFTPPVSDTGKVRPEKFVIPEPEKGVAAAATPKKPKKEKDNPRSYKARDARSKTRGRLPVNATVTAVWMGSEWRGGLDIYKENDELIKRIRHQAEGLFRLMEELDIMFWEWFAKEASAEEKARLVFAPHPPEPAPWPDPSSPEGTVVESR